MVRTEKRPDRRLYLPQSGGEDAARCAQAGIPPQAQVFRTKAELGLEMIQAAQAQSLPFAFVGMDAHYGEQPWLLSRLEATFCLLKYRLSKKPTWMAC